MDSYEGNLKSVAYLYNVRFEVFTAVTMKNGVFWDVMRVTLVRIRATRRNIPKDAILLPVQCS
jgi:hypothetical protein